MTSRLDGLDNELLNLKVWNLKLSKTFRREPAKKLNVLESKTLTLESEHDSLELYVCRSNIEINGIPDSVRHQNLEEKVVGILNEISVNVSPKDIRVCHCVGVSRNSSTTTIVYFINRKHAKKALISRQNLRKSSSPNCNDFVNENFNHKKTTKLLFLVKNLNAVVILIKYMQETDGAYFKSRNAQRKIIKNLPYK